MKVESLAPHRRAVSTGGDSNDTIVKVMIAKKSFALLLE
jgi:hypothetical protein